MQFSPRLLKKAASASMKKYSRNCTMLKKEYFWNSESTDLVEEKIGFFLPDSISQGLADLEFTTRIS